MSTPHDDKETRHDRPWPSALDFIFNANMTSGTVRFVVAIVVYVLVFGTLAWLLR